MASDLEFINYVVDQIDPSCDVRVRAMFGGHTLYSKDKVVALIGDNQLFVKPTEAGRNCRRPNLGKRRNLPGSSYADRDIAAGGIYP